MNQKGEWWPNIENYFMWYNSSDYHVQKKKNRAAPVWILNQSSEHKTICQNFSGNIIYRFIYGINSPPISEESYRTPLSIITKFFQPPE